MKKTLLIALFLICPSLLFGMKVEIDENSQSVQQDTHKMVATCKSKCPSNTDDLECTEECLTECLTDYSHQAERFLIRKYTAKCANIPFKEEFSFKPDIEGRVSDLANTVKAYKKWKDDKDTRECAKAHIAEVTRVLNLELERSKQELAQLEKEENSKPIRFMLKIVN